VECWEISYSIIQTHKNPSEPIIISLLGSSKKIAKSYGDVTLVREPVICPSLGAHRTTKKPEFVTVWPWKFQLSEN
jgi:hypothetical protein